MHQASDIKEVLIGRQPRISNLLSYPNFVRGLLLDNLQPLVCRFEILGVLCCTINEVPRRVRNQKEAG